MTENTITPGISLELEFEVLPEHSAAHIGSGTVQVLSTPSMIAFMEITALKLLDAQLPEGSSSVGSHVDVRHLAPSLVGCTVRVRAEWKPSKDGWWDWWYTPGRVRSRSAAGHINVW